MSTLKKFAAGASALALAAGATLAGTGAAGAQGSSEIAADLELAATALNGPVKVSANAEGGPTVTYTNTNEIDQRCVGFTMPYSTVEEQDIDPGAIGGGNVIEMLPLILAIEDEGGISVLSADEDGAPTADNSAGGGLGDPGPNVVGAALALLGGGGVAVDAGESITWTATQPDTPSAAVILCQPDPDGGMLDINFGIDPQIVADQINDRLGPLGSITAGSVSGGSVEMGASVLGSLGGGSGDNGTSEPGEGNGDPETESGSSSSGMSESGSGGNEEEGAVNGAAVG